MKINKKQLLLYSIIIVAVLFLSSYKLDYYIYQPGGIYALDEVVEVDQRFDSEGELHLVTVRGGQATPIYYLWAKIRPHYQIYDLEQVRPEGISQEEYMNTQLHFMESSQEAATVVAYEAADKDITIDYQGVYIMAVVDGMPAEGHLMPGDQIIEMNGQSVTSSQEVMDLTSSYTKGDEIELTVIREDQEQNVSFELDTFPDEPDRVGMGVSLVTDREVEVNPDVHFNSGSIGGPSAGLMMSLEIYDQLTSEDITKGYQVAGTGEIDYDGKVYRIGGIDKKVVAADRDGAEVFFAPNEGGIEGSNYEIAKQTAEEIGTDMEIVPVDTFQDALDYLNNLEHKS
ncbi:SepM family pheromone-processing serine protease [Piscibacillus halophilus]|uniref:endopeptidase La n=1 Tax=Piscibacillus halophilus TaxID=571933 RepID=A0A1H8YSQ8_9BACI|nr:SepM family pheromone-processing serine protease [Piscibacillus halophilus]SEP55051.1 PDZ domain-containing protein [Piscibacillus halophilus]